MRWKHAEGMSLRYDAIHSYVVAFFWENFLCFFYPKSVLMTDLGLWLGRIWVVWLLLLGFLGGEFLFVVFEVFA